MESILQCNYFWITVYNHTFVTEIAILYSSQNRDICGQQELVTNQLQHSKYPVCSVILGQTEQFLWLEWMETPEFMSLIFLCAPIPEMWEREKTPSLDKEVWATEGLTAGGSWKGHQQKNQKINWDGKCLKHW